MKLIEGADGRAKVHKPTAFEKIFFGKSVITLETIKARIKSITMTTVHFAAFGHRMYLADFAGFLNQLNDVSGRLESERKSENCCNFKEKTYFGGGSFFGPS